MKRSLAVLLACMVLAACTPRTVQKAECPAVPVPENKVITAETPADNLPPETSPTKQESAGETEPVLEKQQPANILNEETAPQTSEESESPADKIAEARQRQTLPAPTPDQPTFKDEETIPLEERLLSPLAYEPVRADGQKTAPWAGESLKYGLYYSFIKAGTAYIKTRGISTVNGRDAYLIQTTAFSASAIDPFFKVRDVNYSWLDAENFYSLGYSQSVREGSYKRDEWLTFDYPQNAYYGELRKKAEPRVVSGILNEPVLDMLTSLYFVRAQGLTPGKDVVFDIVNREKQYPLIVKVLRKETVKTPAGKFDCIVVEPQFRGEGIFVSKGKSLQVWLTDDEYKMPVKMKTEVFIGSVSAELLEYKRN